jgi:hypothetical protein
MTKRKLVPFLALTVVFFFVFLWYSSIVQKTWPDLPQRIGLGDHLGGHRTEDTDEGGSWKSDQKEPDYVNWNPKPDFKPGSRMPGNHNWTTVLVITKTKEEDVSWMDEKLPDTESFKKAIYVADDPTAPLHPPKNKGHEVMVYLSWIIDNYDSLPDVAVFMHAHERTWHNDDILNNNAADLVRRLSRPRVWREGYVNMRCSWHPGCPDWMHPGETQLDVYKQEEVLLAKSWSELFPLDPVPSVLAQPCCAQFALSRERIHAKPHSLYVWYRNWLLSTKLPDFLSGRIWEYVWQFVFTGDNIYCPKENVCFCDQFGSCFGGDHEYDEFMKVKNELGDRHNDLNHWEEMKKAIEKATEEGRLDEAAQLDVPEPGKDEEYKKEIERLSPIVDRLKDEAVERGKDPKNRAKEAGREWHEGDGY